MRTVGSLACLLAASLAARAVQGSCGAALSCPAGSPPHDGALDADVQLVQKTVHLAAGPDEVVPPALASVMPIAWVHVPKCGSSFLNTLINLPRMCDSRVPKDLVLDTDMAGRFIDKFKEKYRPDISCRGFMETNFGHPGIEATVGYPKGAGHFMIMLRDPEQRIISAYHDMQLAHRWELPGTITHRCRSWGGWASRKMPTLPDFAQKSRGCVTRMLTRAGCPCGPAGGMPSDDELAEAKRRLREGFVFVGLTEQWDLSMCLFDAMFKTGCHPYQFHNARPGRGHHDAEDDYNAAKLEGVTDPYDGEVYAEGRRIFEQRLRQYNVSEASCGPCYANAGSRVAATTGRARARSLFGA